ncbi:MAG: hypothetical protein ACYTEO_17155 [Planctomycetota bacterium]|jgi:hypothetical protein
MEVHQIQSVEISVSAACEEETQRWVEEHARRLQDLFEQWQKPLCIDGEEYRKYLTEKLLHF